MFKKMLLIAVTFIALSSYTGYKLFAQENQTQTAFLTQRILPTDDMLQNMYELTRTGYTQLMPTHGSRLPAFDKEHATQQLEVMYTLGLVWQKATQGTVIVVYEANDNKETKAIMDEIIAGSDDITFVTINKATASAVTKKVFDVADTSLFITFKDGKEVTRSTTLDTIELTRKIPVPANVKTLKEITKKDTPKNIKAYLAKHAPNLSQHLSKDATHADAALFAYLAQEKKPIMVKFSAAWCGPCKTMKPIVNAVAQDYINDLAVVTVELDETNQHILQAFHANSIPTFIFFKNGKKVDQFSGGVSQEKLIEKIETIID